MVGSTGIYDLTKHVSSEADPEYVEAIRDKMQTTSDVVKAFVNLTAQSHAGPSNEELRRRCLEAETEVSPILLESPTIVSAWLQSSALRSELSLMRAQLRDSESQRDRVYEQLLSAEKRGDRLQSKSNSSNTLVTEVAPAESTPAENGSSPPVSLVCYQVNVRGPMGFTATASSQRRSFDGVRRMERSRPTT